jgi:hypothetical protein
MEKISNLERPKLKMGQSGDTIEIWFSKKLVPNLCAIIQRVIKRSEHLYLNISITKKSITLFDKDAFLAKSSKPKCYFMINYKKLEAANLLTLSREENITLYFYRDVMLRVLEGYKLFGKNEPLTLIYRKYMDLNDLNLTIKINKCTLSSVSYPDRDPVTFQFNTFDKWHLKLRQEVINRLRQSLKERRVEAKSKQCGGYLLIDMHKIKFYPGVEDTEKITFEDLPIPGKSVYIEYFNNNPNMELNHDTFEEMVKLLISQNEEVERNLDISSYALKLYLSNNLLKMLEAKAKKENVYIVDDIVYDDKISLLITHDPQSLNGKFNFYSKNKVNGEVAEELYFHETNNHLSLVTKKQANNINPIIKPIKPNKKELENSMIGIVNQSIIHNTSSFLNLGTSPNKVNASIRRKSKIKHAKEIDELAEEPEEINSEKLITGIYREIKQQIDTVRKEKGIESNANSKINTNNDNNPVSSIPAQNTNSNVFNIFGGGSVTNVQQNFLNKNPFGPNPPKKNLQTNNNSNNQLPISNPSNVPVNVIDLNRKQNESVHKPEKFDCELSKIAAIEEEIDSNKTVKNLNEIINIHQEKKPIDKNILKGPLGCIIEQIDQLAKESKRLENSKKILEVSGKNEQDSSMIKENKQKKKKTTNNKKNKNK